jgi:hypothetical protein
MKIKSLITDLQATAIFLLFFLSTTIFYCNNTSAQTDPGTENLKHQWTFDDGFATDIIGTANGTLQGGATISNKALNTSVGGYISFPGNEIEINTYSELTSEVWFKSSSGQNSGHTMLVYFGDADVDGWKGTNYIFTSPSNGGNCRLAISTGNISEPWSAENGVNNPSGAIDDGQLHQLVSVIDDSNLRLYVDGTKVGSTSLTDSNKLSAVSPANAFLCKSGYSGDELWKGYTHKYSIYNKALSDDEVLFLYQQGAESSTSIEVSVSSLSFDEINTTSSFTVTGMKLSNDIAITAPDSVTVEPATLDSNVVNASVNVIYDGSTEIDEKIILSSDDIIAEIPVKAQRNSSCFTPLYNDIPNLIPDPFMNTIVDSWGNTSVVSGSEVWCGSSAVLINGNEHCWPNGGSVATNSINWLPNTTYRFRAKVKTMDGTFTMGVQNANVNGASGDYNILVPFSNGEWIDFDASFTTGSNPGSGVAFFNNCGSASGLTAYIDNWELYAVPGISTSVTTINFDEFTTTTTFTVTGVNLSEPITVTATDGIIPDQTNLNADVSNATVTISCENFSGSTGSITLSSGSISKKITVNTYTNECYTPLYPEKTNLIEDPWLSDLNNFWGWGTKSINTDPLYSYCGVSSGEVSENGSINKDLTGKLKPNTTYRMKAKVYRKNPGNLTYTLDVDSAAYPTQYKLIKTAMDSALAIYNQYFPIDNNIYVYYSAGIPTAQASYYGSIGFGASSTYMWVGTAMHEIDHYLGSGTATEWKNLAVGGKWTGEAGNKVCQEISGTDISSDKTHFWPHGINYRSEIENLGGHAEQLAGLHANARVAKAMIVDDAGLGTNKASVGLGVYGWNAFEEDIYREVTETESWKDIDFTFTTGDSLGTNQGVYFNAGPGYIDNWELYEISSGSTSVSTYEIGEISVYPTYSSGDFNIITPKNNGKIAVYDLYGKPILERKIKHKKEIVSIISTGMYIVRVECENLVRSFRVVKIKK